jgi:hypothetical protein
VCRVLGISGGFPVVGVIVSQRLLTPQAVPGGVVIGGPAIGGPTSPKASSGSRRLIEAGRPEPVRRTWAARRGTTWIQLARPDPLTHDAGLRKLLIQNADHLAVMTGNGRSHRGWPGLMVICRALAGNRGTPG